VVEGQWRVSTWQHDGGDGEEDRAVVAVARVAGPDSPPYLPGSSLRGALRAHLGGVLPDRTVELLGPEPPEDRDSPPDLVASAWWVLGAVLPEGSWRVRARGQSGIDRGRRAPYRRTLRTAETVEPVGGGPHVYVYLRCDPGDPQCVADMLDALACWRPRI